MDMDSKDTSFDATSPPPPDGSVYKDKRSSHVLTGVFLIALGCIFLVDRMGWQWGWHLSFGRLWPLLLVVAGIGTALTSRDADVTVIRDAEGRLQTEVQSRGRRRYSDGFFLVLVGVLMLLQVNHVLYLSQTWPLFVVVAGLSMIFGRGRRRHGWRSRREGR
jgi:hypothetical protein